MYRQVLNGFALQSLNKSVQIPDFHLMVGSAECLSSLPLQLNPVREVPNEIVQNFSKLTENNNNEEIAEMIANNQIEVNDLNVNIATLGF